MTTSSRRLRGARPETLKGVLWSCRISGLGKNCSQTIDSKYSYTYPFLRVGLSGENWSFWHDILSYFTYKSYMFFYVIQIILYILSYPCQSRRTGRSHPKAVKERSSPGAGRGAGEAHQPPCLTMSCLRARSRSAKGRRTRRLVIRISDGSTACPHPIPGAAGPHAQTEGLIQGWVRHGRLATTICGKLTFCLPTHISALRPISFQ